MTLDSICNSCDVFDTCSDIGTTHPLFCNLDPLLSSLQLVLHHGQGASKVVRLHLIVRCCMCHRIIKYHVYLLNCHPVITTSLAQISYLLGNHVRMSDISQFNILPERKKEISLQRFSIMHSLQTLCICYYQKLLIGCNMFNFIEPIKQHCYSYKTWYTVFHNILRGN